MIDLVVHPLRGSASHEPLYMVVFQDIGGIKASEQAAPLDDEELENGGLRQIEMELRATKERLQTTTEELESANEELKSSNEELSSMNEELQSANEELETSKEELQSINEELQTVNAELHARVEELSRANSDVANLLESTQIATLFLDRDLNVKSFTPAAKGLFRLVESDSGRPITHVRARFRADTVHEDAERVLRTLATIERRIEATDDGTRYAMRMMPYRTVNNVIAGVVITFVDVTETAAIEARVEALSQSLRERLSALETLLDLLPVGVVILQDTDRLDEMRINRYGAQLLGEGATGDPGGGLRPVHRAISLFQGEREIAPEKNPVRLAVRAVRQVNTFEGQLVRADGSRRDVMILSTALPGEAGDVRGGIAAIVDISDRKAAEARQQVLLYELQHRVKNIIATISALASRLLRDDITARDFVDAFQGRLRSMASTHEVLSRANWRGASLSELVEMSLRPLVPADSRAVGVHGPEVTMTPAAAATLGMVFYELATNAAKYGALARSSGHLDVTWQVIGLPQASRVVVRWTETGSKPAPETIGGGFGVSFIKRSIEYELQGKADMQLEPDGVHWTLEFPASQNVTRN
jgi:two-component system CheB/CheR fusion protein